MRIGFVTRYDSEDVSSYSGTALFMLNNLRRAGFSVVVISSLRAGWLGTMIRICSVVTFKLFKRKKYFWGFEPSILNNYAKQIELQLVNNPCDVIISPGALHVSYLSVNTPIVLWSDATFAGLEDYYSYYSDLTDNTRKKGHLNEQAALDNCALAIYSSDWAARTSIDNYQVDPEKIRVVPYGANMASGLRWEDLKKNVNSKYSEKCKLLFIGKDWQRKGGDLALAVTTELIARGLEVELHVVGCKPPKKDQPYVIEHGFISKDSKQGIDKLEALFLSSHFLILPSQAECCAMVFAEAGSYGLPCLARDTGGITTAIKNGVNGWAFDVKAGSKEYCDYIEKTLSSQERYIQLSQGAFQEYSERLNWDVAIDSIRPLLEDVVAKHRQL